MAVRVILYSGGLDSFIGAALLEREQPGWKKVYFNIGSRYSAKEAMLLPGDVYHYRAIRLAGLERDDGFVPQRNVLLVTAAQAFNDADEIALCGVRGEYSRDKHPTFYRQASQLLSYTAGKPVRVFSPFERKTKSQAVAMYLKAGLPIAPLLQTVSCYHPTERACGECMSCFRRWVALENNGLQQEWSKPPWDNVRRAPLSSLRQLPPRAWWDFAMAQRDVVFAYHRLHQRL